jgi:hypothetical protein
MRHAIPSPHHKIWLNVFKNEFKALINGPFGQITGRDTAPVASSFDRVGGFAGSAAEVARRTQTFGAFMIFGVDVHVRKVQEFQRFRRGRGDGRRRGIGRQRDTEDFLKRLSLRNWKYGKSKLFWGLLFGSLLE